MSYPHTWLKAQFLAMRSMQLAQSLMLGLFHRALYVRQKFLVSCVLPLPSVSIYYKLVNLVHLRTTGDANRQSREVVRLGRGEKCRHPGNVQALCSPSQGRG